MMKMQAPLPLGGALARACEQHGNRFSHGPSLEFRSLIFAQA